MVEIPRLQRVVPVHTNTPFHLKKVVHSSESITVEGKERKIKYVFALVPLDCIDDISHPDLYNPRKLKEDHRDLLLGQIGTYGLVYPLVATLEREGQTARLLLIDGRHRYYSLLELDAKLKKAVIAASLKKKRARESISISDPERLREPSGLASQAMKHYEMPPERFKGGAGAPMVPVKIYLSQDEVERIGMAVFLNKGQKKLAGGEEIEKLAKAFEEALQQEAEAAAPLRPPSEAAAVARVIKTNSRADNTSVVLSPHVAHVMNDEENPWWPVIGRWQGEQVEDDGRSKPLTAKNFLSFVAELTDATPKEAWDERQRDREMDNLSRLGSIFQAAFEWPKNIPGPGNKHTATAVLCRSFLIRALGAELNDRFGEDEKLLSSRIPEKTWKEMEAAIQKLRKELDKQAKLRAEFEDTKRKLTIESPQGEKREALLSEIDDLRGKLWSLDTIVPTLRNRIRPHLRGK